MTEVKIVYFIYFKQSQYFVNQDYHFSPHQRTSNAIDKEDMGNEQGVKIASWNLTSPTSPPLLMHTHSRLCPLPLGPSKSEEAKGQSVQMPGYSRCSTLRQ